MSRNATMFGPDTFLGVDPCTLDDAATYEGADVVIVNAPSDAPAGARPALPLRIDALRQLRVLDAGDVGSAAAVADAVTRVATAGAVPFVLGAHGTIALSDITGVALRHATSRIAVIHIEAHAENADTRPGHPHGPGRPTDRLLESGAVRADRLVAIGPCGSRPGPGTQPPAQGVRRYAPTEIAGRGLDACVDEATATAARDCDGVFLAVDLHASGPCAARGTDSRGGLTTRQLLHAVRRLAGELPLVGLDVVEVSGPHDYPDVTAFLGRRVVLEALSGMASRRRGDTWRPARPLLVGRGTTV
ncbi:arginase family protein [Streptomyces chartreusis]|uniref:arginase family protein n=1 Tax=Streptomyces chartreusis TaxID=1969 RepID=UPI00341A1CDA